MADTLTGETDRKTTVASARFVYALVIVTSLWVIAARSVRWIGFRLFFGSGPPPLTQSDSRSHPVIQNAAVANLSAVQTAPSHKRVVSASQIIQKPLVRHPT